MKEFICGYVAIAGRPNVGKSTLANKLLNFPLSIITRKPQTTRHKLLGILSERDYQVIFQDTPGILVPTYALQKLMVKNAWSVIEESDLILLVTEPCRDEFKGDTGILKRMEQQNLKVILAVNKIDLIAKPRLLPLIDFYDGLFPFVSIVPISALRDNGLDELKKAIISNLPHRPPFYPPGELTDRPQRFFAAEIVRQKVFDLFGEEVPYSVAVVIEDYKEREASKDYIKALVVCERDSQKAILIGKRGEAIKKLGRAARDEIEAFVGKGVFLELKVEVRKNWRKQEKAVRHLGQA
jgi:GTP-binding protein Era